MKVTAASSTWEQLAVFISGLEVETPVSHEPRMKPAGFGLVRDQQGLRKLVIATGC